MYNGLSVKRYYGERMNDMKKITAITITILVLIIIFLSYAGYTMIEQKREISEHVSARINENVSELNRYIESLNSGFINQASTDRGYVYVEMTVNQLDADIETLKLMYPKMELRLDEIISSYAHLVDRMIYGLDRHRAMELMGELNVYVIMYQEADVYSRDGSYKTLLLKDEYVREEIYEAGSEKYRKLMLEIATVR